MSWRVFEDRPIGRRGTGSGVAAGDRGTTAVSARAVARPGADRAGPDVQHTLDDPAAEPVWESEARIT